MGRGQPDGGPGTRRDRDSGRRAGVGPRSRRRRRPGRGDPWADTAFRLRLRRGNSGFDPGVSGRVHTGRQRRADHQQPRAGTGPCRAAGIGRGRRRSGNGGGAQHRADSARTARKVVTAKLNQDNWDAQLRPHLTPYFAYAAAFVIAVAHVVLGLLLKIKSSGVIFQTADQVAMAGLGFVLAGLVLLFARPRLRVGAAGLSVRNLLGDRLVPWSDIVGVSFPSGARWARIDLPDDEYIPLMAIQSVDKDRAVEAMDTVRTLLRRYRPDLPPNVTRA